MSGRRSRKHAKRMQRTNLAMRSVCPSAGYDPSLVGLQTVGRFGFDTGRSIAIEKGPLLAVVQPKAVGRLSVTLLRGPLRRASHGVSSTPTRQAVRPTLSSRANRLIVTTTHGGNNATEAYRPRPNLQLRPRSHCG